MTAATVVRRFSHSPCPPLPLDLTNYMTILTPDTHIGSYPVRVEW